MEYRRFTRKDERGFYHYNCTEKDQEECFIYENCGECYGTNVLYRLAELEDKIEAGKMIELPCNVGDKVYIDERVWRYHSVYFNHIIVDGKFIVVGRVTSIRITRKQIIIRIKFAYKGNPFSHKTMNFPIGAIKKTVFLTREEAENQLKELQNG